MIDLNFVLAIVFVFFMILDGVLTYQVIKSKKGQEVNPFVLWLMGKFGVPTVLSVTRVFGVLIAIILYMYGGKFAEPVFFGFIAAYIYTNYRHIRILQGKRV